MPGWLLLWFFTAVVVAYFVTEAAMARLYGQRGTLRIGDPDLRLMLVANLVSLLMLLVAGLAFSEAVGGSLHLNVALVSLCAQAIWLGEALWRYYRDHPRLTGG